MASASISIIIPARNGARALPHLFRALERQQLEQMPELLLMDSASDDGTPDMATRAGWRVISIPREEFDHGGTRSQAAIMASGEILVYLTQDAIPATADSIALLIAPLQQDLSIAACCGRQLPNPDATLFGAHLRLFNYGTGSVVRRYADREAHGLKSIFISNSFAAWRKSALAGIGYFGEGELFAEDALAVGKLLRLGHASAYVAEATVYHSHNYSLLQEFRRYFDVGVFHRRNSWLLDEYGRAGGEGRRFVASELRYLLANHRPDLIPLSLLRSAIKLAGYTAGRHYSQLPSALRSGCSMNPGWWGKNNPEP